MDFLADMYSPAKFTPAVIEFVDIAGLVKGASKGEGLGNKFLSHIREVDAILHVVRCFESDDVTHVDGKRQQYTRRRNNQLRAHFCGFRSAMDKRIAKSEKYIKTGDKKYKQEMRRAEGVSKRISNAVSLSRAWISVTAERALVYPICFC